MLKPLFCCKDYLVSDEGYVLRKNKKDKLKPGKDHGGYQVITIMCYGKRKSLAIHTDVARTFLSDSYREGLVVNHKDGNKQNNKVSNLEWCTPRENALHSIYVLGNSFGENNKCSKPVHMIDKLNGNILKTFSCRADASRFFYPQDKVKQRQAQTQIWRVTSGRNKTYKGYIWKDA